MVIRSLVPLSIYTKRYLREIATPGTRYDFNPLSPRFTPMPDITPAELHQRQQAGETPTIIDVREPWEFEESRIPGAQNVPLGALPQQLDDLEDLKDQEVIVHCKSGARASAAKAFLTQQGFPNVRNLTGGIMAYQAQ